MAKSSLKKSVARLSEKAKADPAFFQALIWDTENAVNVLDFLTIDEKAAISELNQHDLIVGLATGDLVAGGVAADGCGASCGGSCGGS